jgi:hypothetical protein
MSRKHLLSIDGGGIRGIIPLCALIELEKQLNKPARDAFHFMAGTSTGAIICGGLAQGLSAKRCLELYRQLSASIFKFDLFGFLGSLFSFKYRSKSLHDLLVQLIGDPMLNELPIDIMITAMRVRDGRPFYFVKDNPNNAGTTGKLRLSDCITASSAAPTYFDPWNVPGIGECVDGGVGIAGNPCYQQCVEAFDYTLPGTYTPSNTTVVALGTGYFPSMAQPANLLEWVRYIIDQLLEEPMDQQTQLVQRHYVPHGARLFRWNPQLPRDIKLDDVGAIDELISIGRDAAAELDWHKILADKSESQKTVVMKLPRNQVD